MDFPDLKNFGHLYTGKASARVIMALFTSVPAELGFLGTPKFLARFQSKDRYWKKTRFRSLEERAISNPEVIDGIRTNIAFFTSLVAACGREKTMKAFPKLAEKLGLMIYEDFMPTAKDFLHCHDPWEAVRGYFLEFFAASQREGVARFEIVSNTDTELQVHYTDCAWHASACEAGYPELMRITANCDAVFMPRLMREIGRDFRRDQWLCGGDPVCDWHFYRNRLQE